MRSGSCRTHRLCGPDSTPHHSMSRVLALVPARGGSKGIPDKNIRPLAGRTLLEYAARVSEESGVVDRIILSTDSERIAEEGRRVGLEVPFLRPSELAQDDTPMLPVIEHAVDFVAREGWDPEIIVLLQPTSPLRTPAHIRTAIHHTRYYCHPLRIHALRYVD